VTPQQRDLLKKSKIELRGLQAADNAAVKGVTFGVVGTLATVTADQIKKRYSSIYYDENGNIIAVRQDGGVDVLYSSKKKQESSSMAPQGESYSAPAPVSTGGTNF
jgi:hypothetical protein